MSASRAGWSWETGLAGPVVLAVGLTVVLRGGRVRQASPPGLRPRGRPARRTLPQEGSQPVGGTGSVGSRVRTVWNWPGGLANFTVADRAEIRTALGVGYSEAMGWRGLSETSRVSIICLGC